MNQTTGLKRNIIDKFYTSKETVELCMGLQQKKLIINEEDLCIEPSSGNGAFIKHIKLLNTNHRFYDLEPDNSKTLENEIKKQDYLLLDLKKMELHKFGKIHVIGNPPFGRQSSLVIKFIKKSAEFCDSISFILPKSFKKDSLKKHFPLKFHLILEKDLPDNSFEINNTPYNVPCVFQIWEKKEIDRKIPKKLIPKNFKFVNKENNPDISFRRVGVNAGKIDKNSEDKSSQSHYFIKFENIQMDELFDKLQSINYASKNNTVGPKSISKQELIKEFNMVL